MIAFRVVLNGRRLVTAGLPGHHVVSAILASVSRNPARKASTPSEPRVPERELELSVSGLDSDLRQHFDWIDRPIKVGDRIEIEVLETDDIDDPAAGGPKRAKPSTRQAPSRAPKQASEKKPAKKSAARKKAAPAATARPRKKK